LPVVRPAEAGEPAVWGQQPTTLVEAVWHWSGNRTHLTVCDHADAAAGQDSEELTQGRWWHLAGRPVAGLEFDEPADESEAAPGWAGGLPHEPLRARLGKTDRR
jgi:uncharacterized protein YbjT (DUF2867 family)